MFEKVPFDELNFVDDGDVVEEPVKKETDLTKYSEHFEYVILIIEEYLYDFFILYDTFEESKQLPGILDRLYDSWSYTK
jgi:hypothetical protein